MSDEIKNEQQEQQTQPEVVVDETLDVKPKSEETEVKDEPEAEAQQDVAESATTEKENTQAEETASEVSEEVPTQQESEADKKDDKEVVEEPEVKSDEVPEASAEAVELVEAPRNEELEKAKAELAEKEAELNEEKAIKSYEDDVREANKQYDEFLTNLGNAMLQEFAKYGIDANTNLEELRKSDPAKAQVAENIIRQAQQAKDMATRNVQNNLNDRLTDVVFTKASRLFDKYELTHEQGEVAAETFVNILSQSGIRDMGDDLIAKVELAVARAKLLKPKVEKVIDDAKAVVKEAKEAVKDVIEAKAPTEAKAPEKEVEEVKEETAEKEEAKEEQEVPKVESVVEAPSIDEFKESAVISNQAAGDAITEDNVLEQMAKLPFKERTAFYAQHRALCERAMAKHSEAESKRKRI